VADRQDNEEFDPRHLARGYTGGRGVSSET
jgi:hypothetical protein